MAIISGFYMSFKDIPIISHSATNSELDNKIYYDTLIRLSFNFKYIGDAIAMVYKAPAAVDFIQ